jgi:hypothetical protein
MASPDFSKMRDSEVLKAVQPGITSDVDKYFIELAHYIVDKDHLTLGESVHPDLDELEKQYESAKYEYQEDKTPETELKMLKAQYNLLIAQKELLKERKTEFSKTVEKPSAFFPKIPVKAGLKTRRRKHRNGSSRVRRHRSQRVSGRKDKA